MTTSARTRRPVPFSAWQAARQGGLAIRSMFVMTLALASCEAAMADATIDVRFSAFTNLTYQLDCVSDLPLNCSRGNLLELWKREFLATAADREMLAKWSSLRSASREAAGSSTDSPLDLPTRIRVVGLQASSIADYGSRLEPLVGPTERLAFENVLRHFEPRFERWWRREAEPAGRLIAEQTQALATSPPVSTRLGEIVRFYRPELPTALALPTHLLYVPTFKAENTGGQQVEGQSLMEFHVGERPEQRIDVAIHELCHFFFARRNPKDQETIGDFFAHSSERTAGVSEALLDEALAAALGNGIVVRDLLSADAFAAYVERPRSFYGAETVDRAAKAILPLLSRYLSAGRSLDDPAFPREYLGTLAAALGDSLELPRFHLAEMLLVADDSFSQVPVRRQVKQLLQPVSLYSAQGSLAERDTLALLRENPRLNALLVVPGNRIQDLLAGEVVSPEQMESIGAGYRRSGQVLFERERGSGSHVYVLVADSAEPVANMLRALAAAPAFHGLYAPP